MIVSRPDTDEYARLLRRVTDLRAECEGMEDDLRLYEAECVMEALNAKKKGKIVDQVKIIGNNEEQKLALVQYRLDIKEKKREMRQVYNDMDVWKATKEFYVSDNYHISRAGGIPTTEKGV